MNNQELTLTERERFRQLDAIAIRTLHASLEFGGALREIRDEKLYREKYGTFEEYCRKRFNISRPRAYQLMDASEVAGNLSTELDITRENRSKIPEPITKESQLRPLTKLKPKQQKRAWEMAKKSNPNPTAKDVKLAVEKLSGVKPKVESPDLRRTSTFEAAFKLMRMRGEGRLELDFGEFGVTIFAKGNN